MRLSQMQRLNGKIAICNRFNASAGQIAVKLTDAIGKLLPASIAGDIEKLL